MENLIKEFPAQLSKAREIAKCVKFTRYEFIKNVVIAGMGGSGIGASIVKDITAHYQRKPVMVGKRLLAPRFC